MTHFIFSKLLYVIYHTINGSLLLGHIVCLLFIMFSIVCMQIFSNSVTRWLSYCFRNSSVNVYVLQSFQIEISSDLAFEFFLLNYQDCFFSCQNDVIQIESLNQYTKSMVLNLNIRAKWKFMQHEMVRGLAPGKDFAKPVFQFFCHKFCNSEKKTVCIRFERIGLFATAQLYWSSLPAFSVGLKILWKRSLNL